jgi:hypothetical protein
MEYWNDEEKHVARGDAYLRWEGQAMNSKMLGTLGILGTFARFLGEFARFSRVPKSANGTLAGGRRSAFDMFGKFDRLTTSRLTAGEISMVCRPVVGFRFRVQFVKTTCAS